MTSRTAAPTSPSWVRRCCPQAGMPACCQVQLPLMQRKAQQQQQRQQEGTIEQHHSSPSHQQHQYTHHKDAAPPHLPPSQPYAHAPALHKQLPPQHPWPPPQPHQHPANDFQPTQHPTQHHSFLSRPTSASPLRSHSPPWHLASAQLPSQRPASSHSSPQSRASSPRRQSAPPHASNNTLSTGAHSLEPAATTFTSSALLSISPTRARPTSARPSAASVFRPASASPSASSPAPDAHARHVPARPMSASPIFQHLFASKRPSSASAITGSRPPWRPSSPHPSSSGALNNTAAAAHAVQGGDSEEWAEPMYDWQVTGNPSHRHGMPTAYQLHAASAPGAAPDPWASPSTEPAPAALPWPIHRPLSATSNLPKRPSSASQNQASDASMHPLRGVDPPSSEARVAIIRQQQQQAPWPKAANRDRDPAHAMARAATPPLNSVPRFPFSPPPGAPSNAYPTPQPWASTAACGASPETCSASTPLNLGATATSIVSGPAVSHSLASSMGQIVGVGRRGGGLAHSRPASASRAPHEQVNCGGIIYGSPAALQKLELPMQTEQGGGAPMTEHPSSPHPKSPYRSRPLSAAPALAASHHHGSLRHSSPSMQRPLSASPQLALDRPSPTHTRIHKAAAGQALPRPAIPRPRSGGPSSPLSMPPQPSTPSSTYPHSGSAGLGSQAKTEVQRTPGAILRARPHSAVVLSPSGVPSKRARPPTAGLWGSGSNGSGNRAENGVRSAK
mmetsp:Transcript_30382/g.79009  ORF Transcript_30382/g.79009 Transcript_30382/m.79009 type:complete len:733 (-) Transcript_30382:546-2744(-)